MSEEKIGPQHRERKAILYVRQSSLHQVEHNRESRRLQYGMRERLELLGWQEIEVVDDDLGRSGESSTSRTGFQHMVAEVCLGNVGAVAAREVSRFARNNKDWYHLVELCRIFDTLLIDQDVIYDARRANDRLLLGVKGTLSEYELDLLRIRAHEARHEKAARGELSIRLPVGFVKTESGIEKDPDRRVQKVVSLVFSKFMELNSARQTLLWFLDRDLELPVGIIDGRAEEVIWKRASYRRVLRILTNPMYAGAYAYGKTSTVTEARLGEPRKRIVFKPRSSWSVLLRDHHDAYVSWDTYEHIQRELSGNSYRHGNFGKGAVKRGPALLAGLLRCRRCGRRLSVAYSGRGDVPRYTCNRGVLNEGEPPCISFGGIRLDERVCEELLRVVEPAAIDAALLASDNASSSHDELISALQLDLKEARYAVDRARKRYEAVDPANRLVAEELEARWNAALLRAAELEQRIETERSGKRPRVATDRKELLHLADHLAEVWNDASTDVRLKKRILRTVIHEIVVDLDDKSNEVLLTMHWVGGVHTELRARRQKRGQNAKCASDDLINTVRLLARVCGDDFIAGLLNKNGHRTGSGNQWTQERLAALRYRNDIARYRANTRAEQTWMTLKDAATHIGVAPATLRRAAECGAISAEHPLANGPWIFERKSLASADATALVERIAAGRSGAKPLPGQLTLKLSNT